MHSILNIQCKHVVYICYTDTKLQDLDSLKKN